MTCVLRSSEVHRNLISETAIRDSGTFCDGPLELGEQTDRAPLPRVRHRQVPQG
jgi:hypothetical protein